MANLTPAQNYDRLVTTMKDIGVNAVPVSMRTDLVDGEVISTSPLSLRIHGESDLVIPASLITLSPFCTEKKVTLQTGSALNSHAHSFSVTSSGTGAGTATGVATGTITGTTADDKTVSGTAHVDVSAPVKTTVEVSGSSATDSVDLSHTHTAEILLWRGLQTGDRVRVLRYNQGNAFYVLDRGEI